jgi:hypothetical protein
MEKALELTIHENSKRIIEKSLNSNILIEFIKSLEG